MPEHALSAFGVGAEVAFKVAAWPDETFTGKVRFVGATVRRATRDLLVEAVVDNKDERLRPGMFAVAEVKLGEVTLPVVPEGRPAHRRPAPASIASSWSHDGRVEERLVHTGPSSGRPGRHPDRREGRRAGRARARRRPARRPAGPVAQFEPSTSRGDLPCNG